MIIVICGEQEEAECPSSHGHIYIDNVKLITTVLHRVVVIAIVVSPGATPLHFSTQFTLLHSEWSNGSFIDPQTITNPQQKHIPQTLVIYSHSHGEWLVS